MKLLERHAAHFDMLNVRTTKTLMVVYQWCTAVGQCAKQLSAEANIEFRTQQIKAAHEKEGSAKSVYTGEICGRV